MPRSASGLSVTVSVARLSGLHPLLTPTVVVTAATAGSAWITAITARWRSSIARNEMLGSASVDPVTMPVSWIGRNPLGTTM